MLSIEAGRLGFLVVILVINIALQLRQPEFISPDILGPLYILLFLSFTVNAFYIWFDARAFKHWYFTAGLFALDSVFITGLIFYTGVVQSIFIFLYLVNIIFCGMIFQKKGAFLLALLTSTMFSLLLILRPEIKGEVLFLAVGMNNLGFFSVAFLSGYLSEQLSFMGMEISARKKDIKELRDLNDLIVKNVTSGLITVDLHGQIMQYNRAAEQIVDRPYRFVGFNINDIFPGFFEKITVPGNEVPSGVDRFEIIHANSRDDRLILGFSVSLLKRDTHATGYILIFQDLTQIKRLEKAMRRSEKLAAVGQLAAGIAHEIRNPLAGISGSLQLLRSTTHDEGSEEYRLMSIALKEIDRLNHLITEFLDFVRPEGHADEPVGLNEIVREVVEMARWSKNFRTEIKIETVLEADRLVLGNRDKLKQVIYNLVLNSIHALDKAESPVLRIETRVKNGLLVMVVKDNGSGMSDATLKRLFEPFHTTKPKGTGLGLATVHKILENHDARVFVESELGKGTEFTIEFSKLADPSAQHAKRGNG
ncbi:MAG: ATP-binding protein [Bdellovibrionia bacterium]